MSRLCISSLTAAHARAGDPSIVSRCASAPPAADQVPGERRPYHQITQTRLGCGQLAKCRTNSSLHKMPHKRSTAKARNLRTNSDPCGYENIFNIRMLVSGGEGGIRTPDTVTRMPHFECGAFNRSATSPTYWTY